MKYDLAMLVFLIFHLDIITMELRKMEGNMQSVMKLVENKVHFFRFSDIQSQDFPCTILTHVELSSAYGNTLSPTWTNLPVAFIFTRRL